MINNTHITTVRPLSPAAADEIGSTSNTPVTRPTTSPNSGGGQIKEAVPQAIQEKTFVPKTADITAPTDDIRRAVLAAYREASEPLKVLAKRFNISAATVVVWAKQAGLPGRRRGRVARSEPTEDQKMVLAQIGKVAMAELAKARGCSRQAIHQLRTRYPQWVPPPPRKQPVPKRALERPRRKILKDSIMCFRISKQNRRALKTFARQHGLRPNMSYNRTAREILLVALEDNYQQTERGESPNKNCRLDGKILQRNCFVSGRIVTGKHKNRTFGELFKFSNQRM